MLQRQHLFNVGRVPDAHIQGGGKRRAEGMGIDGHCGAAPISGLTVRPPHPHHLTRLDDDWDMGERAMTACRCALMAVEHNIKPALLLADQYRRELAALPHEVGEAFYFVSCINSGGCVMRCNAVSGTSVFPSLR